MNNLIKLFAKVTPLALVVPLTIGGCTVVAVDAEGNALRDSFSAAESAPENISESELLTTGLPFVNTGSVLFPSHQINQEALATSMAAYVANFEYFLPRVFYVNTSEFVRGGPGTFYEPLRLVKAKERVMLDGKSGSWYRLADRTGYFPAGNVIDLLNPTGFSWVLNVVNEGYEEEVDACLGGLTNYLPMAEDLGVPVWAMHGNCGGESAYNLEVDNIVTVDDNQYRVISHLLLPLFSSTEALRGETGQDAFILVCDLVQGYSHVIGLKGI